MALGDYGTALVTGASSGIGEATVRALAARGIAVTALARHAERLAALAAETGCETIRLDLRDRARLHAALDGLETDIVVNNAGVGLGMTGLLEAEPDHIEAIAETNVTAALHLIRAVVPGMVARKRGHLVNIGSVAGLHPVRSALYGASKGAIHSLSQTLRLELVGSGVRVTEICPGRVRTAFFAAALDDDDEVRRLTCGFDLLEASDIADAVMFALDAPWRVNVSTIEITPTEQAFGGLTIAPVARD
jgi:NADP-dependent 3-hydroxy acid dehydrogenase YdfG